MSGMQFDALYQKHYRVIYGQCRRILGNHHDAEDAVQEVFCRVAKHRDTNLSSVEILPWIHRVASNYCLNELRNAKRRPKGEERDDVPGRESEDALLARDLVDRLLERMPMHLFMATWRYHVDGMTHDEVGQALGMSRRTVINYLGEFQDRARRFMRS